MLKEHRYLPSLDGRGLRGGCPKFSPPYQVRGRLQPSPIIKREREYFLSYFTIIKNPYDP